MCQARATKTHNKSTTTWKQEPSYLVFVRLLIYLVEMSIGNVLRTCTNKNDILPFENATHLFIKLIKTPKTISNLKNWNTDPTSDPSTTYVAYGNIYCVDLDWGLFVTF